MRWTPESFSGEMVLHLHPSIFHSFFRQRSRIWKAETYHPAYETLQLFDLKRIE
jgi:hypothetical protein